MDLRTLKIIIDMVDCVYLSDTPIYASQVNSNGMCKVVGVQVKKSFADNGCENTWIEIQFGEGIVPNE